MNHLKTFLVTLLFIFTTVLPSQSYAWSIEDLFSTNKKDEISKYTNGVDDQSLRNVISNIMDKFNPIETGAGLAKKISTGNPGSGLIADQFAGVLFLLGLTWVTVIGLISGRGLAESIGMLLSSYVLFMIILFYYDSIFHNGIASMFNAMVSSYSLDGSGTLKTSVGDTIVQLFMVAVGILAKMGVNFTHFSIVAIAEAILVAIPLLYAAFSILKCAIKVFLMFFLGDMVAGVMLAIGPFFVAAGVLEATREFFNSWLKVLLSSLAIKLVSAVVIALAGQILMNSISITSSQKYAYGTIVADAFITILLATALSELLDMVPSLASTLFNGGLRIGANNLSAIKSNSMNIAKGTDVPKHYGQVKSGISSAKEFIGNHMKPKDNPTTL